MYGFLNSKKVMVLNEKNDDFKAAFDDEFPRSKKCGCDGIGRKGKKFKGTYRKDFNFADLANVKKNDDSRSEALLEDVYRQD